MQPVYQANIEYLEDYLPVVGPDGKPIDTDQPASNGRRLEVAEDLRAVILGLVTHEPGITTHALLRDEAVKAFKDAADGLNLMIATQQVYVDLHAVLLSDASQAQIYPSENVCKSHAYIRAVENGGEWPGVHLLPLEPGCPLLLNGEAWSWLGSTPTCVTLVSPTGKPVKLDNTAFGMMINSGEIKAALEVAPPHQVAQQNAGHEVLRHASESAHREALRRAGYVLAALGKQEWPPHPPEPRTLSRWVKAFEDAEMTYGSGYYGLIPKPRSGNTRVRVDANAAKIMDRVIAEHYLTTTARLKKTVYNEMSQQCDQVGVTEKPSLATFYNWFRRYSREQQLAKREGTRSAYVEKPYARRASGAAVVTWRAWRRGHIDHTKLDIELIDPRTGKNLGRPWLTVIIDEDTRRILAIYPSFDSPSYATCMSVIRVCVKRWGRLPDEIVVDNGPEFVSVYFGALMATCGVRLTYRPPSQSRFGAVVERVFDTLNTEMLHNLVANTEVDQTRQSYDTGNKSEEPHALVAGRSMLCSDGVGV